MTLAHLPEILAALALIVMLLFVAIVAGIRRVAARGMIKHGNW